MKNRYDFGALLEEHIADTVKVQSTNAETNSYYRERNNAIEFPAAILISNEQDAVDPTTGLFTDLLRNKAELTTKLTGILGSDINGEATAAATQIVQYLTGNQGSTGRANVYLSNTGFKNLINVLRPIIAVAGNNTTLLYHGILKWLRNTFGADYVADTQIIWANEDAIPPPTITPEPVNNENGPHGPTPPPPPGASVVDDIAAQQLARSVQIENLLIEAARSNKDVNRQNFINRISSLSVERANRVGEGPTGDVSSTAPNAPLTVDTALTQLGRNYGNDVNSRAYADEVRRQNRATDVSAGINNLRGSATGRFQNSAVGADPYQVATRSNSGIRRERRDKIPVTVRWTPGINGTPAEFMQTGLTQPRNPRRQELAITQRRHSFPGTDTAVGHTIKKGVHSSPSSSAVARRSTLVPSFFSPISSLRNVFTPNKKTPSGYGLHRTTRIAPKQRRLTGKALRRAIVGGEMRAGNDNPAVRRMYARIRR